MNQDTSGYTGAMMRAMEIMIDQNLEEVLEVFKPRAPLHLHTHVAGAELWENYVPAGHLDLHHHDPLQLNMNKHVG
eukprot:CAMPEP_0172181418 /NCGR_PEP_ID=MMETSP1050-20130122/17804_1 /TAXON_ID=233186 /ORGANISM="Cryptomonas curvata, Strain CCAP979/52" /LENGTH=75 /DNA_ID=CAMNT_0012854693 /DNA_START=862 /DNA_END=1089 /DNA_ORIENTATION=+